MDGSRDQYDRLRKGEFSHCVVITIHSTRSANQRKGSVCLGHDVRCTGVRSCRILYVCMAGSCRRLYARQLRAEQRLYLDMEDRIVRQPPKLAARAPPLVPSSMWSSGDGVEISFIVLDVQITFDPGTLASIHVFNLVVAMFPQRSV